MGSRKSPEPKRPRLATRERVAHADAPHDRRPGRPAVVGQPSVTLSPDGLQCAHELGAPRDHADAMKREHDTEPGPPDVPDEGVPPSQSKPRQVTARGLGAPGAHSAPPSTSESRAEIVVPRRTLRIHVNDTMDEAIQAITRRRHRFPVSAEPGRSEHHAPRELPSGNDTLPTIRKVVDAPTDPGAPRAAETPPVEPSTPAPAGASGTIVPRIVLALALGLLVVVALYAVLRPEPALNTRAVASIAPFASSLAPTPAAEPSPPAASAPPSTAVVPAAVTPSNPPAPPKATARPEKDKPRPAPTTDTPSSPNATDIERITPF